jgi:hydroxyacylglutathione hydrolase
MKMKFCPCRYSRIAAVVTAIFLAAFAHSFATAQPTGSMDVHWDEGALNCASVSQTPLQVHAYNPLTYILREGLCTTWEAPFMYLLIGSTKAILIDTGDIADPKKAPLADTVLHLLPREGSTKLPLLVVHSHRHLDHRAGDAQFANLPNVQVVGFDIDSVRHFYNFTDWPEGTAQIDLGDRIIDVLPTPGHNQTEVSFYDGNTGLFFSGDFLMPGRLLIDDAGAELASAKRVAAFVKDRPVGYVLGGHIEMDATGKMLEWESTYHPHEHVLQMTKSDLLSLPAAVASFNGYYTTYGQFTMMNSMRLLIAVTLFGLIALIVLVVMMVRFIRRRRRARTPRTELRM